MRNLPAFLTILATMLLMALYTNDQAIGAENHVCALEGKRLSCGDRRATRADYFRKFSNPDTTDALTDKLEEFPLFDNGGQRETYRRSVEKVWRAVTRHGREQKRRYLRRRLSKLEYLKVEADFEQARKSYEAAINLYRHHIWKPKGSIARAAKPEG